MATTTAAAPSTTTIATSAASQFDYSLLAIIVIIVALVVSFIALLICLLIFCRSKLRDDTNIRKRILGQSNAGFAQEQVKTQIIEQPRPVPVPVPMPMPERHYIQETVIPALPPPPPPQPEVVVHEVVHRYEPPPQPVCQPVCQQVCLPAPQPQAIQRLVRTSSWSGGLGGRDEWIKIKRKKRGTRVECNDSDSSDDEEVCTGHQRYGYGGACMMPSLSPYDLAIPAAYQRRPMMVGGVGAGMGAASYMMGARPAGMSMMAVPAAPMCAAPMVSAMPMMVTGASTFQPTYGMLPRL